MEYFEACTNDIDPMERDAILMMLAQEEEFEADAPCDANELDADNEWFMPVRLNFETEIDALLARF